MIKLPDFLKSYPTQPNDPPKCDNFAAVLKNNFNCFIRRFPIPTQYTNPWDDDKTIDSIRQELGDDQGIIEVEKGVTKNGTRFIASITKTYMGPEYGVQYFLRFNYLSGEEWAEEVDAFFGEESVTGIRESTVMALLNAKIDDWCKDPYDENYTKGVRMNKSESREFDKQFPNHPLSQLRDFLYFLTDNN